jgi:hypothetical protein
MSISFSAFIESMNFVKIYSNFYEDRSLIRKDHKEGVSGIYLFLQPKVGGSFYVGSSRNRNLFIYALGLNFKKTS